MGKRELIALLVLSSAVFLFLSVPTVCLQFVMWYFLIILTYFFLDFLDSVVVAAQNILSSHEGFLTIAMYHHRETISSN